MDVWSWISELPDSDEWNSSNSELTHQLASSSSKTNTPTQSIHLRAERVLDSNSDGFVITFSIHFQSSDGETMTTKTIWASDTCPLSSDKPFLPLVLQILQEIVSCSPNAHDSTYPRSNLKNLIKPDPVSWVLDSHSPESFSGFFNVIFLTRLFWLCVWEVSSEIGSFFFRSLLAPNLETFSGKNSPVLKNFFIAVGTDVELCFMRTFGYMLAKWLILNEVEVGLRALTIFPSQNLGFSYAMESHGLWVLKGYAPVKSMKCMHCQGQNSKFPSIVDARQSLLNYALAHQQVEVVLQLEYTVSYHENYIQVNACVDNLRIHLVKLGFKNDSDDNFLDERHFPSRIRIWIGPEVGASYVGGLSLGRSTDNVERDMEMEKTLKGGPGKMKVPKVKAMAKMATRTKIKNWRWDQDVEGNAAVFDAVLCDGTTGIEIAAWKAPVGGGGDQIGVNLRRRYTGGGRAFTKSGGLIFAGEEYGERVEWRLSREMEGSVLKWRMGGQIWLSYWPNDVRSSYYETRFVEWCDEVDLPLIPTKN